MWLNGRTPHPLVPRAARRGRVRVREYLGAWQTPGPEASMVVPHTATFRLKRVQPALSSFSHEEEVSRISKPRLR